MAISTYLSIITLNLKGLNASTKRYRVAEWIQKQGSIYTAYKRRVSDLNTYTDWK